MIGGDTAYISHGELQTGLAEDPATWAPDLADLYAQDFAKLGDERDLLIARESADIVGIAIVAWETSARRRFAVLEDMAVDPERRSAGVGQAMLREIERVVAARGIDWIFLESGLRNTRAHRFFEREGFDKLSEVFGKRLGDGVGPGA